MGKVAFVCVLFAAMGLLVADLHASQWMIVESAVSGGLQVRTVDGVALACPGGANANVCPVATLDLVVLGFSTAEEATLMAWAGGDGLLVLGSLTGTPAATTAHFQTVWAAASSARTPAPIYRVHREIGGPCLSGGAGFAPPPQECLYAGQLHGAGPAADALISSYDLSQVQADQGEIDAADTQVDQGGVYMAGTLVNGAMAAQQFWLPVIHVPILMDAKPLSQNVPAVMYAGHTYSVSVTMQNVGNTTWTAAQNFRLGSQHPQDNGTWGVARVFLAANDSIGPGGTKTFSFTVTAPAAPGQYYFQWQMLRESVSWFGTKSVDTSIALPTTTEMCPGVFADTTGTAAASAALQSCLTTTPQGGTLRLPVGTYLIDTQIVVDHAVTVGTMGLSNSASSCDAVACAVLRASSTLNDPASGPAKGVLKVSSPGAIVDHLGIDGNRAARIGSLVGIACSHYANFWGYNVLVLASDVTFRYSKSYNALCASGLGWFGDFASITDSVFRDNGNHVTLGLWSDGITIGSSNNAQILRNHIVNSSDVALVLMAGKNALIQDNLIEQPAQTAFAGLVVFRQLDGNGNPLSDGDYSGTFVQNNTLECYQHCFLGLHVGSRPWENGPNAVVYGVTVRNNTVHNSSFGVSIGQAGSVQSPVHVYQNSATGQFPQSFSHLCPNNAFNGNSAYNISPVNDLPGTQTDSVVDFNGENPGMYTIKPMCMP